MTATDIHERRRSGLGDPISPVAQPRSTQGVSAVMMFFYYQYLESSQISGIYVQTNKLQTETFTYGVRERTVDSRAASQPFSYPHKDSIFAQITALIAPPKQPVTVSQDLSRKSLYALIAIRHAHLRRKCGLQLNYLDRLTLWFSRHKLPPTTQIQLDPHLYRAQYTFSAGITAFSTGPHSNGVNARRYQAPEVSYSGYAPSSDRTKAVPLSDRSKTWLNTWLADDGFSSVCRRSGLPSRYMWQDCSIMDNKKSAGPRPLHALKEVHSACSPERELTVPLGFVTNSARKLHYYEISESSRDTERSPVTPSVMRRAHRSTEPVAANETA